MLDIKVLAGYGRVHHGRLVFFAGQTVNPSFGSHEIRTLGSRQYSCSKYTGVVQEVSCVIP